MKRERRHKKVSAGITELPFDAVRVLGIDYKVALVEGLHDTHEAWGIFQTAHASIAIDSQLCEQQRRDTLGHELTHAIEDRLGLDLGEATVQQIGGAWVAMLRENPALVAWLMGD